LRFASDVEEIEHFSDASSRIAAIVIAVFVVVVIVVLVVTRGITAVRIRTSILAASRCNGIYSMHRRCARKLRFRLEKTYGGIIPTSYNIIII
jgi:hypothetical protein